MDHVGSRLLVFTSGARGERSRRPLLPAALAGHELALRRAWRARVLDEGRRAGCEVIVSCPRSLALPSGIARRPQGGGGFGARLRRAMAAAFHGPPAAVIVVGTDVPALRASHLRQASSCLATDADAVVLGPSPDGGVYLIAARRPLGAVLERVRWCGTHARADLARLLRARGRRVLLLEPLADLDRAADFDRWLACRGGEEEGLGGLLRPVVEQLRRLRQSPRSRLRRPRSPRRLGFVSPRAPPVALAIV